MRRPLVPAVVLAALALPLACGGDDDGLGGPGSAGSVSALLELVPDGEGNQAQVVYGSLARVRAAAGLEEPIGDPGDAVGELVRAAGTGWVVAAPFRDQGLQITADEVGFDLTAIDASIEAGLPPDQVAVFTGRFDGDEIDGALTTYEPFADDVEVGERAGVTTYRFGADEEVDLAGRTPARPLGENLRLGVDEGTVWWTRRDDVLDEAIDVAADDSASLADDDSFASAAAALDEVGVYTAVLTGDASAYDASDVGAVLGENATPEQIEALEDALDLGGEGAGLARWEVAALGETLVDGDPGLAIVLAHGDQDAAEDNVERLTAVLREGESLVSRRRWSDVCTRPDVRRAGATVIATCDTERAGLAVQIVVARDSLLLWS